jgi:hypothetical protein
MKWIALLLLLTPWCALLAQESATPGRDARLYEMRTYYAAPGKLEALNARFRNHTNRLFEKHGMTLVGYWTPIDAEQGSDNKLIYLLSYPSKEARDKSWRAFMSDPDWRKAAAESETAGRLVEKVETVFLTATDYSPEIKPARASSPRVFELRTYTTPPGKLEELNARFRQHTMKLFSRHGMTHVGYWTPVGKGSDTTLIYILAHASREAAAESFKAFRSDPEWIKAKSASEVNGSLTTPNGVQSVFLLATDYSPIQ